MSNKNKNLRIKLIANPGAGDPKKSAARLEEVTKCLLDHGLKVDVALAKPKNEAIPIAKKAIKDGYDVIIAMGGDGTIGAVIRGVARSKVRLGIIPAGTENDIALSLGIPEDMEKACEIIAAGNTRKLDLGRLSTKKTKKFYFFMVSAIGLTATIFPLIKEVPEGRLGGIKDGLMTLLKFKSAPVVNLTLDDESKIEVETMLVTIANTPVIAMKNLVAPEASMDDGLLDIAVYPGFSKAELVSYFIKTAKQGQTPDGRIQRYKAKKIKVQTKPKLDVAAEGIILGKGTAKIKLLPRALRVLAPKIGKGAEKKPKEITKALPEPVSPVTK